MLTNEYQRNPVFFFFGGGGSSSPQHVFSVVFLVFLVTDELTLLFVLPFLYTYQVVHKKTFDGASVQGRQYPISTSE